MNILIAIPAVIVVLFLVWTFSSTVRSYINGLLMNVSAFVIGMTPRVRTVLIVLSAIIALIFILGVSWIGFWAAIGSWASSPIAGLIVGIGSLVGILFFRKFTRPIVTIALIIIGLGFGQMWLKSSSPMIKDSADRRVTTIEQSITNALDKSSLKSELESGIFAKVRTPTTAYTSSAPYTPLHQFTVGDMVLVLDTKGAKADKSGEGGVHVMWANPAGDFVAGNTGYIPTRTLDWDWQNWSKKDSPEKPVAPPAKKVVVQQTVTVQAIKPAPKVQAPPLAYHHARNLEVKYVAKNGVTQYFKVHSLKRTANYIEINCAFQMKFVGSSVGNNIYNGRWSQPGVKGSEFEISFSDFNNDYASGGIRMKEGWNKLDLYPI